MTLNINQLDALSNLIDVMQDACVETGITPIGTLALEVPDGAGGFTEIVMVAVAEDGDCGGWHLAVRETRL